jgi:DNA-binding NarL/FixJ family response regulator
LPTHRPSYTMPQTEVGATCIGYPGEDMDAETADLARTEHARIPVMIVDDHPLFREAVGRLIGECREFEIVAEAGDGEEAVTLAARCCPRVVILDIALPRISGIEATRRIKESNSETAVVVLSVYDDAEHVTAVLGAGADAYLTKDVARGEIVQALREVVAGRMFVSQSALRHLVSSSAIHREAPPSDGNYGLTKREMEILGFLTRGLSNREIASELSLSTATIKGHVEGIYSKLKVDSRTEAATTALRLGIVDLSDI